MEREYLDDLEAREEASTPAIVEAIRCGLVFCVKELVGVVEMKLREHVIANHALVKLTAHASIRVIDAVAPPRFLHYNFVSAVLNDLFGIQTRGGCMCAPGSLRFSFNYFMPIDEIETVLRVVTWVADHGWRLLPYNRVDPFSGSWSMRCAPTVMRDLSRKSFRGLTAAELLIAPTHGALPVASEPAESDAKALRVTQRLADRVGVVFRVHGAVIHAELRDGFQAHGAAVEAARWFMHLADAASMLRHADVPKPSRAPGALMLSIADCMRGSLLARQQP
ncbi:hypothetical protein AMAG_05826 [Allomyces macrogynus ATCC 38327]|uniref:Aminotransferase class V domain-containing protein n=1 Tax=Allomyces macrogynus (strain ATCC 38327) TaxID=578462 RepID=A0A0L0SDB4_ALLM3|nr:hypothetical protein AMAG_05826 [Allomyces macrogynus ATCC 38327]|eukprot:KNE60437.1 hypothetical protein AMAG_05826 [Allomyces macrogynus ATCC 38327]